MDAVKWCLKYINKSLIWVVLGITLLTIESSALIFTVTLQKYIVDNLFYGNVSYNIYFIISLLIISFFVYSILFISAPFVCSIGEINIRNKLSKYLFLKYQNVPIEEINKDRIANIVSFFTIDITGASNLVANQLPKGIKFIITAIILIIVIGNISQPILFCMLVASSVYVLVGFFYFPILQKKALEVQHNKVNTNILVEEGLAATKEIIANNQEAWEEKKITKSINTYFKSILEQGKAENRYLFLTDPIKWFINIFVLVYGGYNVFYGNISLGSFIVIYQLIFQFTDALQNSFRFIMEFSNQTVHIHRLKKPFEMKELNKGTINLSKLENKIVYNNVTFKHDQNIILNTINLEIPIGKSVALIGPSGSGKSTIIQLLSKMFEPDKGEILIDGISLNKIERNSWSKYITIVFQDPFLFPDTIRNNLVLGLHEYTEDELINCCKSAQIYDFIINLPDGFEQQIGDRGINLSGGQRQRISIARALLRNPEVLILDESTSALDYMTESYIQNSIEQKRKNKTTIIIAHRISTVKNSDIIYIIDKGKVVDKGKHSELFLRSEWYNKFSQIEKID